MKMKNKILFSIFVLVGVILFSCGISNAATYTRRGHEITIPDGKYNVEFVSGELQAISTDERRFVGALSTKDTSAVQYDQAYLETAIDGFTEIYGSEFKLISSSVIEKDGCTGISIQFRYSTSQFRDSTSSTYVYVDVINFKSDNYINCLYFMSLDRSFLDSTEKKQIYNSFRIKDTVSLTNGIPFTDVSKSSWYYSAVKYTYENNMIKGTNAYTFAPTNNLTRGMLVTILHRMQGEPSVSGTSKFSDVQDSSQYYYKAINWATSKGIINGYNSGKFGPNDPVTREQLAVILSKYCRLEGKYKTTTADLSKFSDGSKVSNFAKDGMKWAVGTGVITGSNGKLNPQGTATRAEVASMLYKYCTKVK